MGSDVKCYKVRVMPDAREQLDEIYGYVVMHLKAPMAAKRLNERLRAAMESLSIFPNRGSTVQNPLWNERKVRFIVVGNYDIYYRVIDESTEIHILFIAYSRRDIDDVMGSISHIVCEPKFRGYY